MRTHPEMREIVAACEPDEFAVVTVRHVAALLDAIDRHGECFCTPPPIGDGPEETCPQHGRTYGDWVSGIELVMAREAELRVVLARVRACADDMVESYEPAGESVLAALGGAS